MSSHTHYIALPTVQSAASTIAPPSLLRQLAGLVDLSGVLVGVAVSVQVVFEVHTKASIYAGVCRWRPGTTSVVIRKNWNDTEKISMAPAQG